eukprot:50718-Eustigmatos_ZCMA.PRE.1
MEVLNKMRDLTTYKFYGGRFMSPELREHSMAFRAAWLEMKGDANDVTCYVCLQDSEGYKTPCGHDICGRCFLKSLKPH